MGTSGTVEKLKNRLVAQVRQNVGWVGPALVLAVVLAQLTGFLYGWLFYWGFNVAGVWMYCDDNGHSNLGKQKWFKRFAMVLMPVGFLGLLAGGGSTGPASQVSVGSEDAAIRRESTTSAGGMGGGHGGGLW